MDVYNRFVPSVKNFWCTKITFKDMLWTLVGPIFFIFQRNGCMSAAFHFTDDNEESF